MNQSDLKEFLEAKVLQYNQPGFIADDPICIPHGYSKRQDIEIAGLMAAILAWGQRKTIIAKCREFLAWMDHAPHDFVLHHHPSDLKPFRQFKHRTFNGEDALYFIRFFQYHYAIHPSLEVAFLQHQQPNAPTVEPHLNAFFGYFFSLPHPARTHKHISRPERKSACKRLNMYLRWMVRRDQAGVDFGLWNQISPSQLICPCDLHVDRVARALGLIVRPQTDWQTAVELTDQLRQFDPLDPVKYDFALFGLGVEERFYVPH